MKNVLFPGTFDPPTLGHLDIIERASHLYGKVFVGVACNSTKKPLFSQAERVVMMSEITSHLANVEVVVIEGLVADYVDQHQIEGIVRGLRAFSDYEGEIRMALANRRMAGVETLFLVSSEHLAHLTSTLVKEIGRSGKHLELFVPQQLLSRIYAALA